MELSSVEQIRLFQFLNIRRMQTAGMVMCYTLTYSLSYFMAKKTLPLE